MHRKFNQSQKKQSKATTSNNPSVELNGQGRHISKQSNHKRYGLPPLYSSSLAKVSNVEGMQNEVTTVVGSMSEVTDQRSQTQNGPAKRNAPKTPNNSNGAAGQCREQDQYLPTANVVRIMRRALPVQAKVADEAKEMVQECVSEFISFLTTDANDRCRKEHRKTVTAEDLIGAMSRLGFEHYVAPLTMYLQKYRENEMRPMINRYNAPYGSNAGASYDSAQTAPNGFPLFAVPTVAYPQSAIYGSGNGVYYHDGSVGSSTAAGTAAYGENGPSLTRDINGGQSDGDGTAGPSQSYQGQVAFYNPYGSYE